MTAQEVITALQLEPLTMEGGYFRRNYCSQQLTEAGKPMGTAIYYLMTPDSFSRLHKLPSDEVYHFYMGDPVELTVLFPDGSGKTVLLGNDLTKGMVPQFCVPAHAWQGSCLSEGGAWALLGTTMAPGFTDDDFVPGDRGKLVEHYREFQEKIVQLTP
ncbi:MAG: cupin domain-containing protein [Oscillospiraceae bacterium]|nr:cupin domain-containing protein [Oscillospiraceae bacterium]